MAGVENAVKAGQSSWFDSALGGLGGILDLGLQGWKGYEDIQNSKDSAAIKNQMSQAEGQTNLAIAQMNASNQRFLNNVLIIGGLGIIFVVIYKMMR